MGAITLLSCKCGALKNFYWKPHLGGSRPGTWSSPSQLSCLGQLNHVASPVSGINCTVIATPQKEAFITERYYIDCVPKKLNLLIFFFLKIRMLPIFSPILCLFFLIKKRPSFLQKWARLKNWEHWECRNRRSQNPGIAKKRGGGLTYAKIFWWICRSIPKTQLRHHLTQIMIIYPSKSEHLSPKIDHHQQLVNIYIEHFFYLCDAL